MKKVVRSIAMVALMFTSVTGMANEPKLKTESTSKNLVLELEAENNKTSIKFVDGEGNVIYSDNSTNTEDYIKKFNLETLPEGTYYLEIENRLKELVYTIDVDGKGIDVSEKIEKLKPVFRKADDKVSLNFLNLKKEDVEIKIFDNENRVVFQELVSNEMVVQRAFDFAATRNEIYTIVVKEGNDTYYESVSVK